MIKEFTTEQKQEIVEKLGLRYKIADKIEIRHYLFDHYRLETSQYRLHCSCKQGQIKPLPVLRGKCQYCGKDAPAFMTTLASRKAVEKAAENFSKDEETRRRIISEFDYKYYEEVKIKPFYVLQFDKSDDKLLYIYRCNARMWIDDDGKNDIDVNIKTITEVNANKQIHSYANTSRKRKMKAFDALAISSELQHHRVTILGYKDEDEMWKAHASFAKYTGVNDFINLIITDYPTDIILYFAMIEKYPVLEQIVKMNYYSLVDSVCRQARGNSAKEIEEYLNSLSKLLNEEATQGSKAMKIPKYIGDYLSQYNANLNEFMAMTDIYQLDKTLTKENFERLTNQAYMEYLVSYPPHLDLLREIASVLTYGYKLNEILKYAYEQNKGICLNAAGSTYRYRAILNYLRDYNHMCDLLSIPAQKFPKDLKKVHDSLSRQMQEYKNRIHDEAIKKVADKYGRIAIDLNAKSKNDYVISLPHSSKDLIEEGANQHNCVGSYIDLVANSKSVVFFIRKKEDQNSSFVTAEYANRRLTQLYYSNNRRVNDVQIRKLAENFVVQANRLS